MAIFREITTRENLKPYQKSFLWKNLENREDQELFDRQEGRAGAGERGKCGMIITIKMNFYEKILINPIFKALIK
jgi:hypothetical protein